MASSSGGDSSSSTSAATPVSLDETDEATAAAIRDATVFSLETLLVSYLHIHLNDIQNCHEIPIQS